MKAARLVDSAQSQVLVTDDAPQPAPGPGELLIRVHAAGVTMTELSWYPTSHKSNGETRVGAIPAHEFSGVVAGVGPHVGCLEVGQEVFGMNDWYSDGAMAEYCIAPFSDVAPKPSNMAHKVAASVPISALTAWQGLFDHAKLQPGESVLIHGGAGAVGTYAIQLARLRGARVITTASAQNRDFMSALGAEQVIDYHASRFEECVQGVDVVFDTVGGETLERSWGVLKPGGRLVSVVSTAPESTDARAKKAFFIVEPNQKQLVEVADLIQAEKLRPELDTVIPLSQVPDLFAGRVSRRHRGKVVVAIEDMDSQRKKQ